LSDVSLDDAQSQRALADLDGALRVAKR